MNRSEKFNFYLPQNIDPIDVSNFDYNFEIIDENLITEEQELTSTQKANARANLDLGDAALQTVANNLTTSSAGSVLDARQGKVLNDKATANGNAIAGIRSGLAIVSSGNTHGAITAGQYVYVHSHSSLSEGLYTANSNISANATLSTSNLTAVSSGALNESNNKLIALNSNSFMPRGEFSSADVNTYTTPGSYIKYTAPINGPSGYSDSFILLVFTMGIGAAIFQILIPWSTTYKKVYMRTYVNLTWQDWMTLSAT